MTKLICLLAFSMMFATAAMGGKNADGSLVVHTDDAHDWTNGVCDMFDEWVVPQDCGSLNTRSDRDDYDHELTPTLIWFIAAFCEDSEPAVTVVYFGVDHNIPGFHHWRWGFCGPPGSLEIPDIGWPEFTDAGVSVAFGTPIAGDILFPVYYIAVWGHPYDHYCSTINPTGGYATYVDDSNPPVSDEITHFGCVRWLEDGYNDCPSSPTPTRSTTWGRMKAAYR